MDAVRSRLIGGSVPLGFLLSHVLFTDLNWLISPQFWSCVKLSSTTLPLTVLVLLSLPFANLVGPLSAIAVVPRLGWSEPHAAQAFPTFWNASATTFWPTTLSAGMLPKDCFGTDPDEDGACPTNVYRSLAAFMANDNFNILCTNKGPEFSCNTSTPASSSGSILRDMSTEFDVNSLTVYSSTPTIAIFDLMANRFGSGIALTLNISDTETIDVSKTQLLEVLFQGNAAMQRPLVKASCQSLSYAEAFKFIQARNLSNQFGPGNVTFLGDIDGSPEPKLLYTIDRRSFTLAPELRGGCDGQGCYATFTCTADARWMPLRLWYNTAQSTLLFQNDPQPKAFFESPRLKETTPVLLKKDWLDFLGTNLESSAYNVSEQWPSFSSNFGAEFPFEGAPRTFSDGGRTQQLFQATNYTQAIAMQLSMMLSQAMAQVPSFAVGQSTYRGNCSNVNAGFKFDPRTCAQSPSYWIHANGLGKLADDVSAAAFTVRDSGYRWGLDSTIVIVALSILLFHALLTLIYLVFIIAFKRQVTTKWSSAPEMLMLAINSLRAPVLMGHSTGASNANSYLWQEHVSIREIDSGEELSLVVGDPLDYAGRVGDLPMVGKKYN